MRPLLPPLLACLLCAPSRVWAEPAAEPTAWDLIYEAADSIDQAAAKVQAGQQLEADRLLTRAEQFLDRASRADPSLSRIAYERARLCRVDGQPDLAEGILVRAMAEQMEIADHVRAVALLDAVWHDQGGPPLAARWRRARLPRDLGTGMLVAGAVASLVGYSVAFSSLAETTYAQAEPDLPVQRAGLGICAGGGGVALAGGVLAIGGQVQMGKLERILPGPWRLAGAPQKKGRR